MPVQVTEDPDHDLVNIRVSGTLSRDDYKHFVPEIDSLIFEAGELNILVMMEHFNGWNAGALWEDVKFDIKHFSDIRRLAMVGDKRWQRWMATVCKLFTTAQIRYFDRAQEAQARAWVQSA